MASSLALKRLVSESLFTSLFTRSLRRTPIASFSTNLTPRRVDDSQHLSDLYPPLISETDDGDMVIRLAIPGYSKEKLKVSLDVEENTLLIEGETISPRNTSGRLGIPSYVFYKAPEIKAEMKNGLLTVFIPNR